MENVAKESLRSRVRTFYTVCWWIL